MLRRFLPRPLETSMLKRLLPAAILALACTAPALAAGPQLKGQAPGWYRLQLGDFEITALNDGTLDLPVDQLLQQPAAKTLKALQHAYLGVPLETSVNAYLVNTGAKVVWWTAAPPASLVPRSAACSPA
jgi:uncharacterized iron-regulated protein